MEEAGKAGHCSAIEKAIFKFLDCFAYQTVFAPAAAKTTAA
jgi:hypothetical protein